MTFYNSQVSERIILTALFKCHISMRQIVSIFLDRLKRFSWNTFFFNEFIKI
jgi:hypothetical protein